MPPNPQDATKHLGSPTQQDSGWNCRSYDAGSLKPFGFTVGSCLILIWASSSAAYLNGIAYVSEPGAIPIYLSLVIAWPKFFELAWEAKWAHRNGWAFAWKMRDSREAWKWRWYDHASVLFSPDDEIIQWYGRVNETFVRHGRFGLDPFTWPLTGILLRVLPIRLRKNAFRFYRWPFLLGAQVLLIMITPLEYSGMLAFCVAAAFIFVEVTILVFHKLEDRIRLGEVADYFRDTYRLDQRLPAAGHNPVRLNADRRSRQPASAHPRTVNIRQLRPDRLARAIVRLVHQLSRIIQGWWQGFAVTRIPERCPPPLEGEGLLNARLLLWELLFAPPASRLGSFVSLFTAMTFCIVMGYTAIYHALNIVTVNLTGNPAVAVGQRAANPLELVYFSVVTMATVGYGDVQPVTALARIASACEILSGVALVVILVTAFSTTAASN